LQDNDNNEIRWWAIRIRTSDFYRVKVNGENCERFASAQKGNSYLSSLNDSFIEMLGQQTDAMIGDVPKDEIRRWRDVMIRKIIKLREENDLRGLKK
jgi:hypothetical protein